MPYKTKGIERPTIKSCASSTQVLLGFKKPAVKRKAETKPRKAYDRAEDRLRTEIIKALRKRGATVFRLEPSFRGRWGVSDLLVFTPKDDMIFMEVKTLNGIMSEDQNTFLRLCMLSFVRYEVVRSVEDALQWT